VIRFRILNGKQAGTEIPATVFPFGIGRTGTAGLSLDEPGVWDRHCEVLFQPADGFLLRVLGSALASLNGVQIQQAPLRNGDLIELGSVQLRFWMAPTSQSSQSWVEYAVWGALGLLSVAQLILIYRLTG